MEQPDDQMMTDAKDTQADVTEAVSFIIIIFHKVGILSVMIYHFTKL